MPVATYLKDKQKKIESKYHQVAKQFESKYDFIHRKVISRFHREIPEIELVRKSLNDLITKSTVSAEEKRKSRSKTPIFSKTSIKKAAISYQENIDWRRGRFSGQTIQIIVRDGKIMEKVFLTPKGNKIFVKRSELGLLLR
tara:strand:- start:231 stop:653 length:423 start_codon:yes stop_codon:yes gene_type:complete